MAYPLLNAVLQIAASATGALGLTMSPAYAVDSTPEKFEMAAASPVESVSIVSLFEDKTWIWSTGGGYFKGDGKFFGWGEGSYGTGRWEVSSSGILCFYSVWKSNSGSTRVDRCFFHRVFNGNIYQLVEGDKDWYLFKHKETIDGDEFAKFKSGDHAAEKIAEIKFDIEQHRARHSN